MTPIFASARGTTAPWKYAYGVGMVRKLLTRMARDSPSIAACRIAGPRRRPCYFGGEAAGAAPASKNVGPLHSETLDSFDASRCRTLSSGNGGLRVSSDVGSFTESSRYFARSVLNFCRSAGGVSFFIELLKSRTTWAIASAVDLLTSASENWETPVQTARRYSSSDVVGPDAVAVAEVFESPPQAESARSSGIRIATATGLSMAGIVQPR